MYPPLIVPPTGGSTSSTLSPPVPLTPSAPPRHFLPPRTGRPNSTLTAQSTGRPFSLSMQLLISVETFSVVKSVSMSTFTALRLREERRLRRRSGQGQCGMRRRKTESSWRRWWGYLSLQSPLPWATMERRKRSHCSPILPPRRPTSFSLFRRLPLSPPHPVQPYPLTGSRLSSRTTTATFRFIRASFALPLFPHPLSLASCSFPLFSASSPLTNSPFLRLVTTTSSGSASPLRSTTNSATSSMSRRCWGRCVRTSGGRSTCSISRRFRSRLSANRKYCQYHRRCFFPFFLFSPLPFRLSCEKNHC
jgi:hypothetical protein